MLQYKIVLKNCFFSIDSRIRKKYLIESKKIIKFERLSLIFSNSYYKKLTNVLYCFLLCFPNYLT